MESPSKDLVELHVANSVLPYEIAKRTSELAGYGSLLSIPYSRRKGTRHLHPDRMTRPGKADYTYAIEALEITVMGSPSGLSRGIHCLTCHRQMVWIVMRERP